MSSLAACALLKSAGLDPVLQVVVRDRNRIALQSDILGASALGIRNVLCLSGDHQSFGNQPQAMGVFDLDSIQFVQTVRTMRDEGTILGGEKLSQGSGSLHRRGGQSLCRSPGFPGRPAGQEGRRGRGVHPDPVHLQSGAVREVDEDGAGTAG